MRTLSPTTTLIDVDLAANVATLRVPFDSVETDGEGRLVGVEDSDRFAGWAVISYPADEVLTADGSLLADASCVVKGAA